MPKQQTDGSPEKDWRLVHLETQPYLRGVAFTRKPYRKWSPTWDHDHCVACWMTLAEPPMTGSNIVHDGYATTKEFVRGENYDWVCAPCFELFRGDMGWRDVTAPAPP
jgi:hypothetical protein